MGAYSQMYLEELKQIPALEEEEMKTLLAALPAKDAAERLINGSLSYVAEMADQYSSEHVDVSDLIQEGNMALMLLVRNYKEGDFLRMRTIAVTTAMEAFRDSQAQNERLEEEVTASVNVLNKVTTMMAEELGREATLEEIAEKMKMPEDRIRLLMKEAVNAVSTDTEKYKTSEDE
ncbi:MAG: RNA polymerase subunit sigma-70 [Lachnospiraceae bacterium]|nr:RNA polymerase subunit sigma-70 [Lachnospiraceae bacterium]